MEIKMIKLVNGEVVLGEPIEKDNTSEVTLKRPMLLMLDPMQGGVGMIPYDAIYTQEELEEFTFKNEHIMHEMKVHSSFEDAYTKQVTGIETITPEIIT
jgi:hypothetical protein